MKSKRVSFCLFCFAICSSSFVFAQKEFFIPKALLMPFHNWQQQLCVSAGIGGGYDLNLSYSFSRHFALFTTGTFNDGTRKRTSFFGDRYNIVKHDQVLTYGAGYFKQPKGKLNVLETYIGYGTDKVNNYWYFTSEPDLSNEYTQADYKNVFWQVTLGRQTVKHNYAFAGRISYSKYKNVLFYDSNPNTAYEKSIYKNVRGINLDPAVCYGYNIKMLSINVQAGVSVPLSSARHTIINTFTTINNGETIVTNEEGTETDALIAAFGRVTLQYTFDFSKRKTNR